MIRWIVLFTALSSSFTYADWPRFLGERFDGVALDNVPIDPAKAPRELWKLDVGSGYGLGAVFHGEYFHFDAIRQPDSDGQPGLTERLRCIDVKTGIVKWSVAQPIQYRDLFGYENGPRSTPAIDAMSIYTLGVSGQLCCRSRADGSLQWKIDTSEKYGVVQNFFGVGSSPLLQGNLVLVMVGGSPEEDQDVPPMQLDRLSANGSAIVAFDQQTGQEVWKCGEDLASYSSPRTMSIDGKQRILLFARTGLLVIDPANGAVESHHVHRADNLESVNAMMPVVDGNNIFLSECYGVGSVLLRATGSKLEVVWKDPPSNRRAQAMRCHWATPIRIDGFLYGCSGRNAPDSEFRCIEMSTGKVRWSDKRRTRCSVTQVGGWLALLEERGRFQWVDPRPGELKVIAQYDLSDSDREHPSIQYPCWAAPVITDGKMILRGDQQVVCYELPRA